MREHPQPSMNSARLLYACFHHTTVSAPTHAASNSTARSGCQHHPKPAIQLLSMLVLWFQLSTMCATHAPPSACTSDPERRHRASALRARPALGSRGRDGAFAAWHAVAAWHAAGRGPPSACLGRDGGLVLGARVPHANALVAVVAADRSVSRPV